MKRSLSVVPRADREIVMTRVFAAPRNLVFDALTKPELLRRWFGALPGWSLAVCDVDLRPGGTFRYVWQGPDGITMGMHGVYKEIVKPERIVSTETFDDPWYPGSAVGTIVLIEAGGLTTLTQTILYETREARDGVLQGPMEKGVAQGYDNLDEVLATL
jgi:uncharacterized protein YndB with AHSA1/START domain